MDYGNESNSNTESMFELHELFFSRTNKKGIIQSGNSVFKRVSGYEWEEIIKRPHNIIRHSDMPRGVFYLLWDRLLSNQPVGAYVKNRSKSGAYYWVFALAIPIEDGFLSIRLKPTSDLFKVVKNEYQSLLKSESSRKLTPAESSQEIIATLKKLGFSSYEKFMLKALLDELLSRQAKLNKAPVEALEKFEKILNLATDLLNQSKEMSESFESSILLPLNLTLQATQLESGGAALSVISDKFAFLSNQIQKEFHIFEEAVSLIEREISKCQYWVCANLLQKEILDFFKKEADVGPIDVNLETSILLNLSKTGETQTLDALKKSIDEFDRLKYVCKQVKTSATGLEIIRLMGRVEISRLLQNQDQLNHMIDDLFTFKTFLVDTLNNIVSKSDGMKRYTSELIKSVSNS